MTALHMDAAKEDARMAFGHSTAATARLPNIDVFDIAPPDTMPIAENEAERNTVFRDLVQDDADLVGLLAYSIYKQNKYDFRVAFAAARGRDPTAAELGAYIVGESTPRRLATYRFLAAAKLGGQDPEGASGAMASASPAAAQEPAKAEPAKANWPQVFRLTFLLLALMAAGAVYLRMR